MLGDDLSNWFDLFAGMAVYRPKAGGGHEWDGWINPDDIESRFKREKLLFAGKRYEATDPEQREALLDAIINYASALCAVKLLERRRRMSPPSLDYRLTPLGRRIGNWGTPRRPQLRKRAVFMMLAIGFRASRYWKVVTIGAAGWAVVNAVRFYYSALTWMESLQFAATSAVVIAVLVLLCRLLFSVLRGHG